jgi:hypothetical protein
VTLEGNVVPNLQAIFCFKVGTLNRTGVMYKGHFDVWLINRLKMLLESTCHLVPDQQTLTGWINGDLYMLETIGILLYEGQTVSH